MIEGCFLVESSMDQLPGVSKKIENQIKAFEKSGFSVRKVKMERQEYLGSKIVDRMPFGNCSPRWKWTSELDGLDFIYMRKPWLNGPFISFLKHIKKKNKVTKILVEFPSYPYDGEMKGSIKNYPKYIKDHIARKRLKGYVDCICSLVDEKEIFGVSNIKILNGYDFSQIQLNRYEKNVNQIRLCCVANFAKWHGYERLLKGVISYYSNGGKRNIMIYFIGDGTEIPFYKSIVTEGNISDHVIFYGQQSTDRINDILNGSDFGIASLGLYKVDFFGVGAFLKTREYLAAGLPIVCGSKLDIMEMNPLGRYILEFPNDDSEINIERIVLMYDELYSMGNESDIHRLIRDNAEKRLDMNAAMSGVIEYIKDTTGRTA